MKYKRHIVNDNIKESQKNASILVEFFNYVGTCLESNSKNITSFPACSESKPTEIEMCVNAREKSYRAGIAII